MNRQPSINLIRPHANLSRVLSLILLSFIVYGTTVEAAHKHGSLLAGDRSHAVAITEPGNQSSLANGLAGCGECLICQLHQDFSTSLVIERHTSDSLETRLLISTSTSHALITRTQTARAGRAPPLAN